MTKKIGQTKRRFIEDNHYIYDCNKEEHIVKRDKSVIKLMEMAKKAGIIKERKRIVKLFKFELDNKVVSYNTLEKLDKLRKQIK